MTIYTFANLLANPAIGDSFDPNLDTLALDVTAIEVRVSIRATYTEFQRVINGQTETVRLAVHASLLQGGTSGGSLVTTSGLLAFGDNITTGDGDQLANVFTGNNLQDNQYHGLTGADTFFAGRGHDLGYGNKGDDFLLGAGGFDTLYGGQGNDYIQGYNANGLNTLVGAQTAAEGGNQLIYGNLDSDTMISGNGRDTQYGGQGADSIIGNGGDDVIYGNKGDDYIHAGSGLDLVYGGQGSDTIIAGDDTQHGGGSSNNVIYGNLDADTIITGSYNDTVYGGQGVDLIILNSNAVSGQFIRGNKDGDSIDGSQGLGADTIMGNGGADTIIGGGGKDTKDTIWGGTGDDLIKAGTSGGTQGSALEAYGDAGADTIDNSVGAATLASWLDGGTGNDLIYGGDSGDTIFGAEGDDTIYGGGDIYNMSGGHAAPQIKGGKGNDLIIVNGSKGSAAVGGANGGSVTTVIGGSGNDSIVGDMGHNALLGGSGSDTIVAGFAGSDTLYGGGDANADYFIWKTVGALAHGTITETGITSTNVPISGMTNNTPSAKGGTIVNFNTAQYSNFNATATPAPNSYKGTIDIKGSWVRKGIATDQVFDFVKGQDKLVFDGTGIFASGSAINLLIATAASGGTKKIIAQKSLTVAGATINNVGLLGQYASKTAFSAAANGGKFLSNGNLATGDVVYGFAANTKATILWLVKVTQADATITMNGGSVLWTLKIPGGMQGGDMIVI